MKRQNPEEPVQKDPDNPIQFGPPLVAAGVSDPVALRYAQEATARHAAAALPKYMQPVAGGPTPPIPPLDAPAEKGLTMADQANMHRAAASGPPVVGLRGGMFQGAPEPVAKANTPMPTPLAPARPSLLPSDILPEEATKDPDFRPGSGSLYAASQPHLAAKYGVIRGTQRIPPQQLGQPNKGLSAKTVEGLKQLSELQTQQQTTAERDSVASSAGAAGRAGNAPGDGPQANAKATVDALKDMSDLDFNTLREMMLKDIINNDKQREIIEARCKPLSLDDIIVNGFVTQRVPVIPGKFEPEFQSISAQEDLTVKRLIVEESKGIDVGDRYLLDKFSFMTVTLGLRGINGQVLPDHKDAQGNFDKDKFWTKFSILTRYPFHMLASLGVNFFWFDIRVRKLFVAEALGNG